MAPPSRGEAWWIRAGYVDLFAQPVDGITGEDGRRKHLLRLGEGQLLVGLDGSVAAPGGQVRLLAIPSLGVETASVALTDAVRDPQAAAALDAWCCAVAAHMTAGADEPAATPVRAGELVALAADAVVVGADPLWLEELDREPPASDGCVMLPPGRAFGFRRPCSLRVMSTGEALAADPGRLVRALHTLNAQALEAIACAVADEIGLERERLAQRLLVDRERLARALHDLGSVVQPALSVPGTSPASVGDDRCALAIEQVLVLLDSERRQIPPIALVPGETPLERIERLAAACQLRSRRILLVDRWWRHDRGVLIAFGVDEEQTPVVLRPSTSRGYAMVRGREAPIPVHARIADDLRVDAIQFYRSFESGNVGVRQTVRVSHGALLANIVTVLTLAVLTGLLALAPPLAIAFLFDSVLPHAEFGTLIDVTVGVGVVALGAACFELTKAVALIRLENGISLAFQAALIDRLLRLPVSFFSGYSSGDLVDRMLGVTEIRRALAGRGVMLMLEFVFSGFSVALLFVLSPTMAALATTLLLFGFLLAIGLNMGALRYQTLATSERGKLEGFTVQLALGISKLRVAAAESRAMSEWIRQFQRQQQQLRHGQGYRVGLQVLAAALPTVSLMVLFAGAASIGSAGGSAGLAPGSFMAFNAAFGALVGVMLAMSTQLIDVLRGVSMSTRVRPLLRAEPEPMRADGRALTLTGRIEFHNLQFRYPSSGAPVLDGLSLAVEAGEYLAIVGPSGSGKSTLFRLLLGFETPQAGAILFDGIAQDQLDLALLRRSMGVVLQQNRISPGNLFQNIVGSSGLGLDDAWRAARLAGLAGDIEALPMGMHTTMMEGGQGLSGGQRQRLLIARALVHRPRIILFDEATSALDNRTQDIVTNTIAGLKATRIVIAHRLSTIERADRVAVLDRGRLVQIGGFADLMREAGSFRALTQRQLL